MQHPKFRVWDKIRGRWTSSNVMFDCFGNLYWSTGHHTQMIDDKDNFIVQQYTGLKDRNGKDICEGDIVSVNSVSGNEAFTGVIKFGYFLSRSDDPVGLYGWAISSLDGKQYSLGECFEMQLTVIGNIQEAPESLTETSVS